MQLLYIHGNYADSEAANIVQVVNMCQAFAQCGLEVLLAIGAPRDKSKNPLDSITTILGEKPAFRIVTFRKFTLFGVFEMLGVYLGVRRLLCQTKADLCYVRDPLVLQLCINAGFLTIFETHDARLNYTSRLLNTFWEKSLLANAKRAKLIKFIAISHALGELWRLKGVPEQKIAVLHDGFSSHIFGAEEEQIVARKKLMLPTNKKVVVYAGRLSVDREPERLINLAKSHPDVCFVAVGGPQSQKLAMESLSLKSRVNNIFWVGHVSHPTVYHYLRAADVLLMLWSWQVRHVKYFSPLKMFEYMAAGRIIVGQAFPVIKEILDNDRTAFLADPDSYEDLNAKLSLALSLTYPSEMASKARSLALAEYSWIARARKILQTLDGSV